MENILKDIEEININQKLYSMTYHKTGLYILYPFLIFIVLVIVALFIFQRDIVIELTGMISNSDGGLVVSALTSGQIDGVLVDNHQDVRNGDVLFTLDTSNVEREIYLTETEINELNLQLTYLNYFEESVISGDNLLPSDNFGYSLRVEQHFRSLQTDGVELNHLTQSRNANVESITEQINDLESLVADFQNFNRLINESSYDEIYNAVVQVRVQEFRANLETFEDDNLGPRQQEQADLQRDIFIAGTLVEIEQSISQFQDEIRRLNEELRTINRNFGQDREILDTRELNASEILIIEIFDSRENVLNQIQTLEIQLENLQEEYQNHTLIATSAGRFQMTDQISWGEYVNRGIELGRIFNIDSENNYILGHFDSSDFNRVSIGQTVTLVTIDGDNNRHLAFGTIDLISEAPIRMEHGSVFVFQATIDTNNSGLILRYGMTGELNIVTGRSTWWSYLINRFFK